MSALAKDRNTPMKDGELISLKVAASVKCYAGGIAVIKDGFVKPGAVETGVIAVGRFEETVDNSSGGAGDQSVRVRTGKSFQYANASADRIAQADVGKDCYVVDDQTVGKAHDGNKRSKAGQVVGVDSGGVWVKIGHFVTTE